ncbi:hypothetical protein TNCT_588521 [Trichonephila clavata]|uniref:Uncharacterized protein n=1 Tax=Trichonephila clavata TaxID=2740835 RepID=A0A8X6LS39_TRICU|nr:hypothetical protein TNCT_588521 [Trichonephila clavata]
MVTVLLIRLITWRSSLEHADHEARESKDSVTRALLNPTMSRSKIPSDVELPLVPQIISKSLAEMSMQSKRPIHVLPLISKHRRLQLQWCQVREKGNDNN